MLNNTFNFNSMKNNKYIFQYGCLNVFFNAFLFYYLFIFYVLSLV